jgi:hypothetical protein
MENGRRYDIVRAESEKRLIWLEGAADFATARSRVDQLLSFWPGKYQIFDLRTKQVVFDTSRQSFLSSASAADVPEIPQVQDVSRAGATL